MVRARFWAESHVSTLLYDVIDDADRLPSIKLRTTRRVNGDCLATILALGGGLKRRKRSQQQVS